MKKYKVRDILAACPDLTYRDLTFWETQGYLEAERESTRRSRRRAYSPKNFELIKCMYKHWKHGDSPADAHRKAMEELESKRPVDHVKQENQSFNNLEKEFVLHTPLTKQYNRMTINMKYFPEIVENIKRIIDEMNPDLIITISCKVSFAVGNALQGESKDMIILPIEKSDEYTLKRALLNIEYDDKVLIFYDQSEETRSMLENVQLNMESPREVQAYGIL